MLLPIIQMMPVVMRVAVAASLAAVAAHLVGAHAMDLMILRRHQAKRNQDWQPEAYWAISYRIKGDQKVEPLDGGSNDAVRMQPLMRKKDRVQQRT